MIKKIIKDYTPNWKALDSTCEQAKAIQDMYDQIREFYNYLNGDDIYKNIEQHIKSSGDLNQFITIDDLNQRKYVSVDVIKSVLFQYLSDWKETNSKSPSFIRNKPTNVSAFTNDVGYLTEHQDISGKADKTEIPTKVSQLENDEHFINDVSNKQDALVSGENIKTINSNSILGRGNIEIGGYEPPVGGIPKTDLAADVQTSLGKADTAIQDISGKADKPLVIVIEDDVLTVPQGTYASITQAVAEGKEVILHYVIASGDEEVYYSSNLVDFSQSDGLYNFFIQIIGGIHRITINNDDTVDYSYVNTYAKPTNGIPARDLASAVQTSLGKADTALQSFTESDPTVPSWAKQSTKPSYSYSEITDKPTIPDAVSGTNDGTNWTSITIGSTTKAIPSGGAELPSNTAYLSNDSGDGIVPDDGIKAVTVTSAAAMNISPDVVTVIDGEVGASAFTLQVPNDNLAHVWDILFTSAASGIPSFVMSDSSSIKYPSGFSVGASKAVEVSVIGIGETYYLRYGEFA